MAAAVGPLRSSRWKAAAVDETEKLAMIEERIQATLDAIAETERVIGDLDRRKHDVVDQQDRLENLQRIVDQWRETHRSVLAQQAVKAREG